MQKEIANATFLKDHIAYEQLSISLDLEILLRARRDTKLKNSLKAQELCLEKAEEYLSCGYERDAAKFYSIYMLLLKLTKTN